MKADFADAMRRATLATRAQDVLKATKIIMHAVTGRIPAHPDEAPPARKFGLIASEREIPDAAASSTVPNAERREPDFLARAAPRARMPLGDVLRALREGDEGRPGSIRCAGCGRCDRRRCRTARSSLRDPSPARQARGITSSTSPLRAHTPRAG